MGVSVCHRPEAMSYCLGHPTTMRFDDECTNRARVQAPLFGPVQGPCGFFVQWLASGKEFLQMYCCVFLPLYYILGLVYVVCKVPLLNPPCCVSFQSIVRFEIDASFPGSCPEERLSFAKRWYSTQPREGSRVKVSSRFTHLANRNFWMERFAFFRWLVLPAQTASATFDDDSQQWKLISTWWMPHALFGWVAVGENEASNG